MRSPAEALQTLALARLTADSITAGYMIYDDNPEQPAYPYIVFGITTTKDWKDKNDPGSEPTLTLDFWSQYPGSLEIARMMDNVLRVLTASYFDLSASGFYVVQTDLEQNDRIVDIDGFTKHGIMKFKYLIQEL